MNISDVFTLLESNQNDRGIKHWQAMGSTGGLSSYGIGLTVLRKLAKKIGRDHQLAQALWQTDCYDAKVIGLLIDEPKAMTEAQVEAQVEDINIGMLTHIFSSCDATLPKAPFAFELANKWLDSENESRKRSAYGLIYEFSKSKSKKYSDEFFEQCLTRIDNEILTQSTWVKMSMAGAIMGIGKRTKALNQHALKIANKVGPIDFNEKDGKCDPFDVAKHLTSDYVKQKLVIK
ncbi:hypothetical protein HII17_14115 [Thalassotalea sp. M1531]|uniref:DNA alkylation repair protein n=1 Tax=Thalassotalea algicola TaxID=2716224 RepID=A0A7Y0LEC9_9GAMM|nr:DNA alkylation repair protein [Thalassotalea algicola]NMP32693.1 hypothetical protein [Thalassotalea algicola]